MINKIVGITIIIFWTIVLFLVSNYLNKLTLPSVSQDSASYYLSKGTIILAYTSLVLMIIVILFWIYTKLTDKTVTSAKK